MPVSIEFQFSHSYEGGPKGIEIPVQLRIGKLSVDVAASLDTGAAFCIFERRVADLLEIRLESGRFQRFVTATGSFPTFEHEVEIKTLDIEFSAVVFFAEDRGFKKNVLGRRGWLDRVRLAIIDYDRVIHLSHY
jgi:hypothetical protein